VAILIHAQAAFFPRDTMARGLTGSGVSFIPYPTAAASRPVGAVSRGKALSCKDCQRTFNALTKTPLAGLRMKHKWPAQAEAMIDGVSLAKAAQRCDVDDTTAFRWRHRFLASLAGDKPGVLSGIVAGDDTFILKSFKGQRSGLPRKARKRGGKSAKRGMSAEPIPVLVARDRQGALMVNIQHPCPCTSGLCRGARPAVRRCPGVRDRMRNRVRFENRGSVYSWPRRPLGGPVPLAKARKLWVSSWTRFSRCPAMPWPRPRRRAYRQGIPAGFGECAAAPRAM
jgi:hypothetical protein